MASSLRRTAAATSAAGNASITQAAASELQSSLSTTISADAAKAASVLLAGKVASGDISAAATGETATLRVAEGASLAASPHQTFVREGTVISVSKENGAISLGAKSNKEDQPAPEPQKSEGVLLEVARQLKQQQPAIGIDIVFFDAEDYGIHSDDEDNYVEDTWCLGSQYWARQAAKTGYMARYGILLDMVGAPNARFCQERLSRQYAAAIVDKVWHTAHAIGYGQYFPITPGSYVTDDHLPLNDVAHIPTIDIIPYDEEYGFGEKWHTVGDNMEWIAPATLHAVGQTILQVIYNEK